MYPHNTTDPPTGLLHSNTATDNTSTRLGYDMLLHNLSYSYYNTTHNHNKLTTTPMLFKRNRSQSDVGVERIEHYNRANQHNLNNRYNRNNEVLQNINLAISYNGNNECDNIACINNNQRTDTVPNRYYSEHTHDDTVLYNHNNMQLYDTDIQLELARLSVRTNTESNKQKLSDLDNNNILQNPILKRLLRLC